MSQYFTLGRFPISVFLVIVIGSRESKLQNVL